MMYSLGNIGFIAPLLPAYKVFALLAVRDYPDLPIKVGIYPFFIGLLEKLLFCIIVLLFIILVIDYFLRKTLDNNKLGHKDIVAKNHILRLNQKIKAIHVWSISLLVGFGLFSMSYQLGPNEYIPPLIHDSGEAYSLLGAMEVKKEATAAINSIMVVSGGVGGVLNK